MTPPNSSPPIDVLQEVHRLSQKWNAWNSDTFIPADAKYILEDMSEIHYLVCFALGVKTLTEGIEK